MIYPKMRTRAHDIVSLARTGGAHAAPNPRAAVPAFRMFTAAAAAVAAAGGLFTCVFL